MVPVQPMTGKVVLSRECVAGCVGCPTTALWSGKGSVATVSSRYSLPSRRIEEKLCSSSSRRKSAEKTQRRKDSTKIKITSEWGTSRHCGGSQTDRERFTDGGTLIWGSPGTGTGAVRGFFHGQSKTSLYTLRESRFASR